LLRNELARADAHAVGTVFDAQLGVFELLNKFHLTRSQLVKAFFFGGFGAILQHFQRGRRGVGARLVVAGQGFLNEGQLFAGSREFILDNFIKLRQIFARVAQGIGRDEAKDDRLVILEAHRGQPLRHGVADIVVVLGVALNHDAEANHGIYFFVLRQKLRAQRQLKAAR
nr:hypothetical protein [Tanacetum cinerariifolium]